MKVCKCCGKERNIAEFYNCQNTKDKHQSWCKKCVDERRRRHRIKFHAREYATARARYLKNKKQINAYCRQKHFERKQLLIAHYSHGRNKCACCGEGNIRFLTIDHISGGGNEHRRKIGFWGSKFYCWLIKARMPVGYQVLCFNCNMGKSMWAVCPHQEDKLEVDICSREL